MKKTIKTILFILLASGIAIAQKTKTIEFESGYTAKHLTASSKYVSVVLKNEARDYKVNIYSRNGDLLFSKAMNEISSDAFEIYATYLNNSLNSVIIIVGERELHYASHAFSIDSQRELWKSKFFWSACAFSPDSTRLLTKEQIGEDGSNSIGILDLNSGDVRTLPPSLGQQAAWLDETKIILIKEQFEFTREYKTYKSNVNNERKSKKAEIQKLKQKFVEGEYTKEELLGLIDKKMKEYMTIGDSVLDRNQTKRNRNTRESVYYSPNKYNRIGSRFAVYDLSSDQIVMEKDLYTSEGIPIISPHILLSGNLNVDKAGDIYLCAHIYNKGSRNYDRLIKLDSEGNIKWISDELGLGRLLLMKHNGVELYFKLLNSEEEYLIDKKSGQLINKSQIDSLLKEKINFDDNNVYRLDTFEGINISTNRSEIKFISSGSMK